MATLTLTDPQFYKDGISGQARVVGYDGESTWVGRYSFTAPSVGGTDLSFAIPGVTQDYGAELPIRYCVTADAAYGEHPSLGTVTFRDAIATGQLAMRLTPGETYYLWFFTNAQIPGWYRFPTSGSITVTGISEGFPWAEPGILGESLTISIQSDPSYTHRLTWQFGDLSGDIGDDLGMEVQWTPPLEMAAAIPKSPTGICTITCATYLKGSLIGQRSCAVTLQVPQSLAPQVTADFYDNSAIPLDVLVEKISRLWIAPIPLGQYGAQIVSIRKLLDGKAYNGEALAAGEHTLTVSATDTRGLTGQVTYPITVLPYQAPQLELNASRCLADGTPDDTGDHAHITITGFVTELPGTWAQMALTYGKMTDAIPVGTGDIYYETIISADPEKTLSLSAQLRDPLRTTFRSMTLSTAYATLDLLKGGKGIALGAVATQPGFHCAMDARFTGKLTDAQGRALVEAQELSIAEGADISVTYARVIRVLGAQILQLQLKSEKELPRYSTLFPGISSLSKTQYIPDVTNTVSLKCNSGSIQTNCTFPPDTYTFFFTLY